MQEQEWINEDNKINMVKALIDIKSEISSLNAKIDDMQNVDAKAQSAKDTATDALNQARQNTKAIKDLKDDISKNGGNHMQWWIAMIDFFGCVISGFIGNYIH